MERRERVAGAVKTTEDKLPRVTQSPQATRNAQPVRCCEGAQEARTSSATCFLFMRRPTSQYSVTLPRSSQGTDEEE